MKRLDIFFLVLILSFVGMITNSCSDRPSNVLKEKEMVSLIVDMELTEAYVNNEYTLSKKERDEMGKRVLEKHKVSEETLDTTLAWYGRNIDEYAKLYEKVDEEINKRRKKFAQLEGEEFINTNELWPYSSHLVISPLSGYDALIFSISSSELEKGEVLKFSFYLPNPTNLKNILGVEYQDGHGEIFSSNSSKNKVEMELHTDSSKVVSRIFGTVQLNNLKSLPLFIDSINLVGEPIDTLHYRSKRHSQKTFIIE